MYLTKENINGLLDLTDEKYRAYEANKVVSPELMKNYQQLLKDIATQSKYKEGKMILDSDLDKIKDQVKGILNSKGRTLRKSFCQGAFRQPAQNECQRCARWECPTFRSI